MSNTPAALPSPRSIGGSRQSRNSNRSISRGSSRSIGRRSYGGSSRASNRSRLSAMGTTGAPGLMNVPPPMRPPSNAGSAISSRNSPRKRIGKTMESVKNTGEAGGMPPRQHERQWIYEPPKSYFTTTYKDGYSSKDKKQFTAPKDGDSVGGVEDYTPASKRDTALEIAARDRIRALVGRTRPAGFYYNKDEETEDLRMQEELYEADDYFDQASLRKGYKVDSAPLKMEMAREATAREVQVKHFLELNRKLHLDMNFYGPQYQGKADEAIIKDLVESKNFEGRMDRLRSKRRHVTLNSSREVQNCISPRHMDTGRLAGYGDGGYKKNEIWPDKRLKERHAYLMKKSRKNARDKMNHFVSNPVTGFMNTLIRNNMKPSQMWAGGH